MVILCSLSPQTVERKEFPNFMTFTPTYKQTRQAWRDIWIGTEFALELESLQYPRSQEILNIYLPYLNPSKPILEAGCGPGHVVYYLREHHLPVIGLDYAPEPLEAARRLVRDLPLQMGDVHFLPYADNYFGAYLSFGVVEHFEHGPGPALKEAYRVLASSGILVLTVPHPQFVEGLYQLRTRIFSAFGKQLPQRAGYYERTYTHNELAHHVKSVGFTIKEIRPAAHSYTFYGLHPIFRQKNSYYKASPLAELAGRVSRNVFPWITAFHTVIIAQKP
jgi:SAM-dependent methyltransferase